MTIRTKERDSLFHKLCAAVTHRRYPARVAFHTFQHGFGFYPSFKRAFQALKAADFELPPARLGYASHACSNSGEYSGRFERTRTDSSADAPTAIGSLTGSLTGSKE